MSQFWLQGVVKNGQVVLTAPLDLPDGTVVTVTDYDPADAPTRESSVNFTDDEFAELTAFLTGKRDKSEWPEFEARVLATVKAARIGPATVEGQPWPHCMTVTVKD